MDKPLLKLDTPVHKTLGVDVSLDNLHSLKKQIEDLPSEAKLLFYKIDGRGRTENIRG